MTGMAACVVATSAYTPIISRAIASASSAWFIPLSELLHDMHINRASDPDSLMRIVALPDGGE